SIIRLTSVTGPKAAKRSCKSFSVTSNDRFPTNSLVFITFFIGSAEVPNHRVLNGQSTSFIEDSPCLGKSPIILFSPRLPSSARNARRLLLGENVGQGE